MTNSNSIPPSATPDLDALSFKISALETELTKTVRRARARSRSTAFLSIITIVFLLGYLGYAYFRFSNEVTPDLVVDNIQTQLRDSLPQARQQLADNLKANAPAYVNGAMDQLANVPAQFADKLDSEAAAHLDQLTPEVQDELYQALKQEIKNTGTQKTPGDDEQRLESTLAAVSTVYGDETVKLMTDVHRTYSSDAMAFTEYLGRLADNKDLDHHDQLYRRMFRTMLMLVRERAIKPEGSQLESTTLSGPPETGEPAAVSEPSEPAITPTPPTTPAQ